MGETTELQKTKPTVKNVTTSDRRYHKESKSELTIYRMRRKKYCMWKLKIEQRVNIQNI